MTDPHQLAEQVGSLDDRQWRVFLDDLVHARSQRNQSEAIDLPKNPSRDQVAAWIARKHLAADPGITDVWHLPGNASEREIRLVEVNALLAELPNEEIIPIDFGFNVEGSVFSLLVLDVTPDQWERLQAGALPLPATWTLQDKQLVGHVG